MTWAMVGEPTMEIQLDVFPAIRLHSGLPVSLFTYTTALIFVYFCLLN